MKSRPFWGSLWGRGFFVFFDVFVKRRTVSLSSWEKYLALKNGQIQNRSLRCTLFFKSHPLFFIQFEKKVCTVVTYLVLGPFFRMNGRSVGVALFEKKVCTVVTFLW